MVAGSNLESRLPSVQGTAQTASRMTTGPTSAGPRPAPIVRAAIFGATGGIGAALVAALAEREPGCRIYVGSRQGAPSDDPRITPFAFDLRDPESIGLAAESIARDGPLDLAFIATGMLVREDGTGPEKSLKQITAQGLAEQFAVNAIGPALVAQAIDRKSVV